MLSSLSVVEPLYPPTAVLGGTVVAELHFDAGTVKSVTVLSGEEPFVSSCKSALSEWRADPEENGVELVVVNFRQPYLYSFGEAKENISPAKPEESLPYPVYIIQPSYPANALGQGCVILRLNISEEGKVTDVQVIKPMGALTDASIEAVRRWKFTPKEGKGGAGTSSQAYAVLVYQFVLVTP